jgi:hypothetical protein
MVSPLAVAAGPVEVSLDAPAARERPVARPMYGCSRGTSCPYDRGSGSGLRSGSRGASWPWPSRLCRRTPPRRPKGGPTAPSACPASVLVWRGGCNNPRGGIFSAHLRLGLKGGKRPLSADSSADRPDQGLDPRARGPFSREGGGACQVGGGGEKTCVGCCPARQRPGRECSGWRQVSRSKFLVHRPLLFQTMNRTYRVSSPSSACFHTSFLLGKLTRLTSAPCLARRR